jgi:hypothetical protein
LNNRIVPEIAKLKRRPLGFHRTLFGVIALLSMSLAWDLNAKITAEKSPAQTVRIRFVDSATGFAVNRTPSKPLADGSQKPLRVRRNGVKRDGQTTLTLR